MGKVRGVRSFGEDETRALINIWSSVEIQEGFKTTKHNMVWRKVSMRMSSRGFVSRDHQSCRNRIKNLRSKYAKIKRGLNPGSDAPTWTYWEQLDAVLKDKVHGRDHLTDDETEGDESSTESEGTSIDSGNYTAPATSSTSLVLRRGRSTLNENHAVVKDENADTPETSWSLVEVTKPSPSRTYSVVSDGSSPMSGIKRSHGNISDFSDGGGFHPKKRVLHDGFSSASNRQHECDKFGQLVAVQLGSLAMEKSVIVQLEIQKLLTEARLSSRKRSKKFNWH